jgi:membrane-associated phospholipid phosphatase
MLKTHASWKWLLLALPLVALVWVDDWATHTWTFPATSAMHKVAQVISLKGDFYTGSVVIVGGLLLVGWIFKNRRCRILALAMILSCAVAGLSSLIVRVGSGRPRPSAGVPDGLYGLVWKTHKTGLTLPDYDYEAFPSGHTTTAVATALPALVMMPALGVPLTVAAVAVAWARFELHRHRLSDLYLGALWGASFGAFFGLAGLKELARRKNSAC